MSDQDIKIGGKKPCGCEWDDKCDCETGSAFVGGIIPGGNPDKPIRIQDLIVPPSELEVVFPFYDKHSPSPVVEYAVMPSGIIVVIVDDDGGGKESLWFGPDGWNPKSYLRRRPK